MLLNLLPKRWQCGIIKCLLELEAMFGQDTSDLARMEKVMLTQNLEGFASCFPDWDLHPPVK